MRSLLPLAAILVLVFHAPLAAQERSDQAKIRNATMAAPTSVSGEAEVRDWDGRVLRAGSNGWVCMPAIPDTPANDAMCLDGPWLTWVEAWQNKTTPNISRMGFGYMLLGDAPASNVDPYATGPTADNEWMAEGVPHLMVLVPDRAMLAGLPTKPDQGGPWVMWRDTPYVHIMVPMPRNRGQGRGN